MLRLLAAPELAPKLVLAFLLLLLLLIGTPQKRRAAKLRSLEIAS